MLLFFASHLTPFAATILAAADLAQSLVSFLSWRQSPMAMLGIGAMILIMALLGLNRRQYCVRARQTALFLEQTRLARDDNRASDARARRAAANRQEERSHEAGLCRAATVLRR